jgi:uracil-DNA glycosylase family 4
MPLSVRQKACLDAMGITVWESQHAASQAEVVTDPQVVGSESVDDWQSLQNEVAQCTRCELHKSRTQTVFGVGNQQAQVMIVGEAPGADEDRQGEPFVGRAGQLLNEMLKTIGLSRQAVYIANILKCRPPNNRDPKPDEAAECSEYLHRQIALIQPRLIVAVGRIAAQRLLQTDTSLGRLRSRVHEHPATGIPLVATYHPAYLLRSPGEKRKAWEDLLFVKKTIESSS